MNHSLTYFNDYQPLSVALSQCQTKISQQYHLQNNPEQITSNDPLGMCLCVDEINFAVQEQWQKAFHSPSSFILGGFAGFLHGGKIALSTYFSHIKKQGTAFIIYGPHLGTLANNQQAVKENNNLSDWIGKVDRPNQDYSSGCCGALLHLLSLFQSPQANKKIEISAETIRRDIDSLQIDVLYTLLSPYKEEILTAESPLVALTEKMYAITSQKIISSCEELVRENSPAVMDIDNIILIGGIILHRYSAEKNDENHYFKLQEIKKIK